LPSPKEQLTEELTYILEDLRNKPQLFKDPASGLSPSVKGFKTFLDVSKKANALQLTSRALSL
jgi:hypothetical protein